MMFLVKCFQQSKRLFHCKSQHTECRAYAPFRAGPGSRSAWFEKKSPVPAGVVRAAPAQWPDARHEVPAALERQDGRAGERAQLAALAGPPPRGAHLRLARARRELQHSPSIQYPLQVLFPARVVSVQFSGPSRELQYSSTQYCSSYSAIPLGAMERWGDDI